MAAFRKLVPKAAIPVSAHFGRLSNRSFSADGEVSTVGRMLAGANSNNLDPLPGGQMKLAKCRAGGRKRDIERYYCATWHHEDRLQAASYFAPRTPRASHLGDRLKIGATFLHQTKNGAAFVSTVNLDPVIGAEIRAGDCVPKVVNPHHQAASASRRSPYSSTFLIASLAAS